MTRKHHSGHQTFRRKAVIIFSLTSVLPLLLFLLILSRHDLLQESETVVVFGLSLVIAVLGFMLFQQIVQHISTMAADFLRVERQELQALGERDAPGELIEMARIADAFNKILAELKSNASELENLVYKLATLSELTELVSRIPDITEVLHIVLRRTMATVHAGMGSIMLVDAKTQTLTLAAAEGLEASGMAQTPVPLGEGIAGRVAQTGEPVLVGELERDARVSTGHDPHGEPTSLLYLPLKVTGRVIGVITLVKTGARTAFSDSDQRFLTTLLNHISFAVENARLLQEARDSARRLQDVLQEKSQQLDQAQQQLLQSAKLSAMGALLAGVAHELNNPLAVIIGQTALLRQTVSSAPLVARAEQIATAAECCARIVHNFLTLARQQLPERQQVRLNDVVQAAVELVAYPLRVDNVEVCLHLAEDLPPLWADPHQLHQVVVNLVANAQQAMHQTALPRRLTLTTRFDPTQAAVVLEVADTGPGVSPEIRLRIFEPFFTTKPPGQGTGLGLSLCLGIIEGHRGSIQVESPPGQGAVFRIALPVEAPLESPRSAVAEALAFDTPGPRRGKTILVVDDEPAVAEVLGELLSADGHCVEMAGSGTLALEKLRQRSYDLILSDLRMPELDGPGLYRLLEQRDPHLLRRLIFLTGDTLSPETSAFLAQTQAPHLSKPFTWEEVRRVIQQVEEAPGD